MTADPWALLRHRFVRELSGRDERAALAYLEQAAEFYEAASNPNVRSRPLLYYYSFLNLAKAALVFRRVPIPTVVKHGISDPRANVKQQLRFEGQEVTIEARAASHTEIFPEVISLLGGHAGRRHSIKVLDLLAQIPSIHRTFCQVTGRAPLFAPVRRVEILRASDSVWARLTLTRDDADVKGPLKAIKRRRAFRKHLRQVVGANNEVWLETPTETGKTSGTDAAIQRLATRLQAVGVWPILTSEGYRQYLCAIEPRHRLQPLAAPYAVMFYLGSITRYKPYDFELILRGGYSWLVSELVATQPVQFVYGLASWLMGVDVVKPYAATL